MKTIPATTVLLVICLLACRCSIAQPGCNRIAVRAHVEVPEGNLSLADLLAPETCSVLVRSAARVRLGRSPLVGSPRVLERDDVQQWLQRLERQQGIEPIRINIPERVSIRRAEASSDCTDLVARLAISPTSSGHGSGEEWLDKSTLPAVKCGVAGRIPAGTAIRVASTKWNAVLDGWDVSVECVHSVECVPFLLRLPREDVSNIVSAPEKGNLASHQLPKLRTSSGPETYSGQTTVVHRGQKVILEWDTSGIRVCVPAVSLDAGALGEHVRARLEPSGRVLNAVVADLGRLRAGS